MDVTPGSTVRYRGTDGREKDAIVLATEDTDMAAKGSNVAPPAPGAAHLAVFGLTSAELYVRYSVPRGDGPFSFTVL